MIIDASVASKWILENEPDEDKARILLENHQQGINRIIVPDLLFYEIANTIATKTELTERHLERSLHVIHQANLIIYYPSYEDVLMAGKLAKKYKASVYDMIYAVTAKKYKTILVTADEKFVKKTKFPFVKLLSDYSE